MATITVIQPSILTETVKRRVAAYCRVSSSSEDQLNSYQAQLTYYSHKFEDSTTEELVDLYADEGITGTRDDKRDEFQRLMKDCRRGKIDRIYTKSISRFARNTKDCLKNLRELKALGITVIFEKENIDTANITDEIMITILGGLAQEESVSISQNTQWAIQKRMKNGTYIVSNQPYGYRKENGSFVVHEEEAMIVRRIYAEFLQGHGFESICRHLNDEGIIMSKSGGRWKKKAVRYILSNEKYIGDCLWRKQYTENVFPFRKEKNNGQVEQYYYTDVHEPIIPRDVFETVQQLMAEKGEYFGNTEFHQYPLSMKIECSECGSSYKRKMVNKKIHWVCRKHDGDSTKCLSKSIAEETFYQAFIRLHNKLLHHYRSILIPIQQMLQELKWKKYGGNIRVMDIHKEIAKLREQNHVIARLRTKGFMDEGKYQEQTKELNNNIRKLQAELKKLTRSDDEDDVLEQLDMLVDYFEKRENMMVSFEPETFDSIVDKITANQNELTFHLLGGIELKEKI